MTAIFENKHTGEVVRISGISLMSIDSECLHIKGFGINFADGTYTHKPHRDWRLIAVKA